MFLKKIFTKIFNNKEYQRLKYLNNRSINVEIFNKKFSDKLDNISRAIDSKNKLNFLHSGHLGDIINTLPVIKELAKTHECNFYIRLDKPINNYYKHPGKGVFLNKQMYQMLYPLLYHQSYIKSVEVFNGKQQIDIDFDIIRELPINLLFDNIRYASLLTDIYPNYNDPFLEAGMHATLKNKIVIQRTFRYRNEFINYDFMNDFKDLIFIGTRNEFLDLKEKINNLEFYDCIDFLDMANIINSSKFIVANSSFAFPIAEGLKVPRLLEMCPSFPAAQPHGANGYSFYFQNSFESLFELLNY